jgi:hypothetical protein
VQLPGVPVPTVVAAEVFTALIGGTQISTGTIGPAPVADDHPREVPCSNPFEKISEVAERD